MPQNRELSEDVQTRIDTLKRRNTKTRIQKTAETFLQAVEQIDDPRTRDVDYPLGEILFIAVMSVLCGSESYEDMATFGRSQIEWCRNFVPLKNGIPSHDTFRRVFGLLKPGTLNEAYIEVFQSLYTGKRGKHIAIDGKVSRGCYTIKGQSLLNMVSAWNTENGVCFGQVATNNEEGKDVGEFNAIPKLIEQLDIEDTLVTIDAGGCYTEITNAIIDGGGSYAITLKKNQPTLHAIVEAMFEEHEQNHFSEVACYHESSRGHGRVEERTYYAVPAPQDDERLEKWKGLSTLVMGRFRRTLKGGETTEFTRFYISSLSSTEVERLGQSLRGHWGIENSLHWVLDVSFGEDANRTRRGHGAENLSIVRRMALGMLKMVKGNKTIPNLQFRAAIEPDFRTTILNKFLMR